MTGRFVRVELMALMEQFWVNKKQISENWKSSQGPWRRIQWPKFWRPWPCSKGVCKRFWPFNAASSRRPDISMHAVVHMDENESEADWHFSIFWFSLIKWVARWDSTHACLLRGSNNRGAARKQEIAAFYTLPAHKEEEYLFFILKRLTLMSEIFSGNLKNHAWWVFHPMS